MSQELIIIILLYVMWLHEYTMIFKNPFSSF